jgi:RNA polymerase sigma factor (sigma-70 family)
MSEVIQHLRRVLRDGVGLTDGQLLEVYISRHDEAAFAALVRRHGPMVWGVCRRVLRNQQDAEDAFQATFLVLVRRAASIASRELLANWLYGVAHQTALKARATAAKRKERERQVTEMPEPAVTQQDQWRDVQPVLDEELSRLPDKYRGVIVLCDLEGKTRKEVAVQLDCPEGTVASRLVRARTMLAKRLTQRGVAMSAGALAVVLAQQAVSAGVPNSVVDSTIKAAALLAAGKAATTGVISVKVAALTEGVMKAMLFTKLKAVLAVVLVLGFVATGATILTCRTAAGQEDKKPTEKEDKKPTEKPAETALQIPRNRMTHDRFVWSVAYSPDGKTLASGSPDPTIKLWDVKTGKEQATLKGHTDRVWSVSFSPDGKTLASGSWDQTIKLWEVATGKEQATLKGHTFAVLSVAYSPDGKTLASGCGDNTIKLWDVKTGKEQATLKGDIFSVWSVAYSPDGKTLASGCGNNTIKLWDVATGKERATFQGHTSSVRSVSFSPDGKTLASGSDDKTIKLWDVATGKEQATLKGHTDRLQSVSFSPDGKTLASGSNDKTIKLWDVKTGKEQATLKGHEHWVRSVSFSPDGKTLASGSNDKTIKLWDVKTGKEKAE